MPELAVGARHYNDEIQPGWCKLTTQADPRLTLICELGETAPVPTQGYGGWETVDRPGRVALTAWRGFAPVGVTLALLLDNFLEGTSGTDIGAAVAVLEALAGRGEGVAIRQPPEVIVDTAGVMPHDYHASQGVRWVIDTLEWDTESLIVNDYGNWARAAVTVGLLQSVTDKTLADRSEAVRRRIHARATTATRTYVAKSGEMLTDIARAKLGDAGRWPELTKLNPKIRDPRKRLKAGTRVRLPAR